MESSSTQDDNLLSVESADTAAVIAAALPPKAILGASRELVEVADEEWIAAVRRHQRPDWTDWQKNNAKR